MKILIQTQYRIGEGDDQIYNATTEGEAETITEFLALTDMHLEKEGAVERKIEHNLIHK
jgi:hypothetical protein